MIKFWLQLWNLVRPYRGRFLLGALFGALAGVADSAVLVTVAFVVSVVFSGNKSADFQSSLAQFQKVSPSIAKVFVNFQHTISAHISDSRSGMIVLLSLIPLVMLARGVCNYLNSYLMGWVGLRAICDLRIRLFQHLLHQPLAFLAKHSTGEWMSRIGDVNVLQNAISVSMVTLVKEPIELLSFTYLAFKADAKMTLIALVAFPFCAIPVIVYNRKGRRSSAAIQTEAAGLGKLMHEAFTGNRIIKGYNLEKVVVDRYRLNQLNFIGHYMRVIRSTETPGPIIEFFAAIGISLLLFTLAGSTTPVGFALVMGSLFSIYSPLKSIIRVQSQLNQAQAATARVFELLATESSLPDPPNPLPLKAAGAPIEFKNLTFSYGDKPVLKNINLRVEPGSMIALVGRAGSGKSTLTNLLLRFYDPTEGVVTIGNISLKEMAVRDIRSQIAVVTQEVILFNDTIRQNIAYGRPEATFEEIQEAARHAFAEDFILAKRGGYEFHVGEKGSNLSGGQRQRIAIARAILKNAPILVLDEATSSLDNESERMVQAALNELMKGRTTICIAHRLSTIQNADVILVMDHGSIVERGTHEELVAHGGIYHKLHSLGFGVNA